MQDEIEPVVKFARDVEVPDDFSGVAVFPTGTKKYFKDGFLHRDGAPAIEWSTGATFWYYNGKRHCTIGPAVVMGNTREWWIDGQQTTPEIVFDQMTNDQKAKVLWELDLWK